MYCIGSSQAPTGSDGIVPFIGNRGSEGGLMRHALHADPGARISDGPLKFFGRQRLLCSGASSVLDMVTRGLERGWGRSSAPMVSTGLWLSKDPS